MKSLTIAYVVLLTAIVVGANLGLLGPFLTWLHLVPLGDKTCHFVLVGVLSFLLCATLSLREAHKRKRSIVLVTIIVLVVLTSLEEMSQSMLVHRQFSKLDMISNIAGICVFGAGALLIPCRSRELLAPRTS